ncbi:hypothetical protein ACHAQH_009119 [Verticillium albo-atrum]
MLLLEDLPYYIFAVVEPALQLLGFAVTSLAPHYFALSQTPSPISHSFLPSEKILTYQLGNLFFLLAVISLSVLNATSDRAVVGAYLSALCWGDLGHIGVTAWCMGWQRFRSVGEWTPVNWACLLVPAVMYILRNMYLLGMI